MAQVVLVDGTVDGSFETSDQCGSTFSSSGWTIVNGTQAHRWGVGSLAGAHHGSKAIYISDQADCSAYQYNITATSVVHFYRDVTIPAGYDYLVISFYARLQGDRGNAFLYDHLSVYATPTSVNPSPGTSVNSSYRLIGAALISSDWAYFQTHICGVAGSTYRIIFSWLTTNSTVAANGIQPPPAIDRIHMVATTIAPILQDVPALPYKVDLSSTCGRGNNFTPSNVDSYCGPNNVGWNMYRNGEDMIWRFVAPETKEVRVRIWGSSPYSQWMLYEGGLPPAATCTPGLTGGTCVFEDIWGGGDYTRYICVTQGQTYYLIVNHTWSTVTATNCGKFDSLLIEQVGGGPLTYGYTSIASLPYAHGPGATCDQRDRVNNSNSGSCGIYSTSNDWVWHFTPQTSGQVTISADVSGYSSSVALYCGGYMTCSDGLDNAICRTNAASGGWPINLSAYVHAGVPYYVVLNQAVSCGTFANLTVSAPVPATPPAGDPCAPLAKHLEIWQGTVLSDGSHLLRWEPAKALQDKLRAVSLEAGPSPERLVEQAFLGHTATYYLRENPPAGRTYYRLRLILQGGAEYDSDLLELTSFGSAVPTVQVVGGFGETPSLDILLRGWASMPISLALYDMQGRLIWQETASGSEERITCAVTGLARGAYLLRVRQQEQEQTRFFLYHP